MLALLFFVTVVSAKDLPTPPTVKPELKPELITRTYDPNFHKIDLFSPNATIPEAVNVVQVELGKQLEKALHRTIDKYAPAVERVIRLRLESHQAQVQQFFLDEIERVAASCSLKVLPVKLLQKSLVRPSELKDFEEKYGRFLVTGTIAQYTKLWKDRLIEDFAPKLDERVVQYAANLINKIAGDLRLTETVAAYKAELETIRFACLAIQLYNASTPAPPKIYEPNEALAKEAAGDRAIKTFYNTYLRSQYCNDNVDTGAVDYAHHKYECERWHVEARGGKVVFKTYTKPHRFLRAFVDGTVDTADDQHKWEEWTPIKHKDGTWSFQSAHGNFLRGQSKWRPASLLGEIHADTKLTLEKW